MDFNCKNPELEAIAEEASCGDEEDGPPGLFDAGHQSDDEDEDGYEVGGNFEGAVTGGGVGAVPKEQPKAEAPKDEKVVAGIIVASTPGQPAVFAPGL